MTDEVNNPAHYNNHPSGIECIQITEHHDFCVGNAIKYLWRAGQKIGSEGREAAELKDLMKARWYLDRKIQKLQEAQAQKAREATAFPGTPPFPTPRV